MKKLLISIGAILFLSLGIGTAFAQPANAAVQVFQNCGANADTAVCKATGDKLFGPGSIWTNIINTLIYVTGAVSVLMIVVGGFRYAASGGDQGSITTAKNTILYAVIGLIVSLMGYAVVNFILSNI